MVDKAREALSEAQNSGKIRNRFSSIARHNHMILHLHIQDQI